MNKSDFKNLLRTVPKTELHLHIEAVITLASVKKLYKKRYDTEMSKEDQTALFSYNDLNGFIQSFLKVQDLLISVDDFNLVFDDLGEYLNKNGICYSEAFFAPTAFLKKGFKYEDMVKVFHKKIEEIKAKYGITIKLIMDVSRTFGCENAMNNYKLLKQYPCEDIIGIGLGGAESKGPAKDYAPVYDLAVKEGYKVVAHAGEDVGPESIWDSLNYLHAQRIGHGLTAFQDEKLIEEFVKTQTPIEICITSNTFTKKIVTKAKEHPVKKYFDKGILVTINTDDPVFFKTTMLDELWICHKELNFSMEEIKQLIKNSFIASFMPEAEKKEWCKKVDASF
ncbi:MAG: adenosine deaminase [Treponema sp.]|nr:adenosine deaminase [Treponema sp.]